ncbi:hypothetical protein MAR_034708 [Mya arenaria]|uniref:SWIM-type domain-containing protein n=1 Tax=Mya arenaria TaxID=6604 RepID=A0ABY7EKX4_MYAAR|nr:hypothetical protein MAR_034708 [Mya arenaria]
MGAVGERIGELEKRLYIAEALCDHNQYQDELEGVTAKRNPDISADAVDLVSQDIIWDIASTMAGRKSMKISFLSTQQTSAISNQNLPATNNGPGKTEPFVDLHVHKETTDIMNLETVANEFVTVTRHTSPKEWIDARSEVPVCTVLTRGAAEAMRTLTLLHRHCTLSSSVFTCHIKLHLHQSEITPYFINKAVIRAQNVHGSEILQYHHECLTVNWLAIWVPEIVLKHNAHCKCQPGNDGTCSHVLAVILALEQMKVQGYKEIPSMLTCTSLPQQWDKPRGEKNNTEPVSQMVMSQPTNVNRKRRPVMAQYTILNLYNNMCKNRIAFFTFRKITVEKDDISALKKLKSSSISYLIEENTQNTPKIDTLFGRAPVGSVLSYHGPLLEPLNTPREQCSRCGEINCPNELKDSEVIFGKT